MRKNARQFHARFSAFAMASVFLFASLASSFNVRPCGIFCDPAKPVEDVEAGDQMAHSCCGPSEESVTFDPSAPALGVCPCDQRVTSVGPDLPDMVSSQPRLDIVEASTVLIRSAAFSFVFATSTEEVAFAAPTRGSPLPRPPSHLLHSSLLI